MYHVSHAPDAAINNHLLLQASPIPIAAGRLRDHRGDYFSERLLMDTPCSLSFSGSFATSFSPGVVRKMGADSGQNL